MTPEQRAYRNLWMRELGAPVPESAANIPGRNALMRMGVRQSVAVEYRRLLIAGVDRETAGILARSPARSYSRRAQAFAQIHKSSPFVDNAGMADTGGVQESGPGQSSHLWNRALTPETARATA